MQNVNAGDTDRWSVFETAFQGKSVICLRYLKCTESLFGRKEW